MNIKLKTALGASLMAGVCAFAFTTDASAAPKKARKSANAERVIVTPQQQAFGPYNAASGYQSGYNAAGPVGGVVGGAVGLGLGIATAPLAAIGAFSGNVGNAYAYAPGYEGGYAPSGARPLGSNVAPFTYGADRSNPSASWTGYDFDNPRDRQLVGSR